MRAPDTFGFPKVCVFGDEHVKEKLPFVKCGLNSGVRPFVRNIS